jgi:sterol desaturase/sphingolipid hydroxylase (fatty acid hydroxylase superfamily)
MTWDAFLSILSDAANILRAAATALLIPALVFAALALAVKRRAALPDARRAAGETRTNLAIYFLDALLIGPPLALLFALMQRGFDAAGLRLVPPQLWAGLPMLAVGFLAVVAGDFIGYWRHRLEHTPLAVALACRAPFRHRDDLAGARPLPPGEPPRHPPHRQRLPIPLGFRRSDGGQQLVRHYWGHFIHADLPWTFGPLGRVIVSPAMHRWHHALDRRAYDTNFATIFSLFDRMFGTYRVPGPCPGPLGVKADMGRGVAGQLTYSLKPEAYRWRARIKPSPEGRRWLRGSRMRAYSVDE